MDQQEAERLAWLSFLVKIVCPLCGGAVWRRTSEGHLQCVTVVGGRRCQGLVTSTQQQIDLQSEHASHGTSDRSDTLRTAQG